MLVTLLGNEFHSEIVLGTKEYKKEFVWAKLKVGGMHYNQFHYGRVQEWWHYILASQIFMVLSRLKLQYSCSCCCISYSIHVSAVAAVAYIIIYIYIYIYIHNSRYMNTVAYKFLNTWLTNNIIMWNEMAPTCSKKQNDFTTLCTDIHTILYWATRCIATAPHSAWDYWCAITALKLKQPNLG